MHAVPMDRIRRLLVGSVGFDRVLHEFKIPAATPPDATDTGEPPPVAFIFPRYGTRPMCVKVADQHWTQEVRPAVLLLVENGDWQAEPFMLLPEFRKDPHHAVALTVSSDDVWIKLLLSVVEDEFRRLPPSASHHPALARMDLEKAFEERIRRYKLEGPKALSGESAGRKWLIASRWEMWNRKKVIWNERCQKTREAGFAMEMRAFKRLCTDVLGLKYAAARAGLGGKRS